MRRVLLAAAAVLFTLAFLPGCQQARDAIAWTIGAPTSAERQEVADALAEAEASREALTVLQVEQQAAAETARANVAESEANAKVLQQAIATASARLPELTGAARDTALEHLDRLRFQLSTITDQAKSQQQQAADIERLIAATGAKIVAADRKIADTRATFEGLDQRTADAVATATGSLSTLGEAVGTYVPGSKPIADQTVGWIEKLLLLGLGVGGTAAVAKRTVSNARATANDATQRADTAERTASGLAEVVQVNDELGLIVNDATLKQQAREKLSSDARAILQAVKAAGGVNRDLIVQALTTKDHAEESASLN